MIKYFIFFLLTSSIVSGEDLIIKPDKTIAVWPGKSLPEPPGKYAKRSGGVTRIEKVLSPSLELYQADNTVKPTPTILIFPGGGYNTLAYDKEGTEIAKWLNSFGITALVLRYTVPNQKEAAFKDAQRAISITRSSAKKWNIDPNAIGVLGFSAGGHLAARVSTNWRKRSYDLIDNTDRKSCRPDFTILIYPAYLSTQNAVKLDQDIPINNEAPPAFIVMTLDDTYINSSLAYLIALKNVKVDAELHVFPKGGHGYGIRSKTPGIKDWPKLCEKWLKQL